MVSALCLLVNRSRPIGQLPTPQWLIGEGGNELGAESKLSGCQLVPFGEFAAKRVDYGLKSINMLQTNLEFELIKEAHTNRVVCTRQGV